MEEIHHASDNTEEDHFNERPIEKRALLMQIFLAIIANLTNISPGMTLAYAAVTLPNLRNPNETFHVSEEEASWIASISFIANPVGCLLAGPLADRFGRKLALLTINAPGLIGWLLIASASAPFTLEMLYAGRLFTGLALGMSSAPTGVYVSEISREKQRGMLVTWTSTAVSMGMVVAYGLGAAFPDDWRIIADISLGFPIIMFILGFILLPESPSWLLLKGRTEEAENNYRKIRSIPANEKMPRIFEEEYQKISQHAQKQREEKRNGWLEIVHEFKKPSGWKPYLIMNTFFLFQQFSGVYVILAYAVDVVQSFGVVLNPYFIAVLIGCSRLFFTCSFGYISMTFGRRKPVIFSGIVMVFFAGGLTIFSYLQSIEYLEIGAMSWFPVVFLISLICTGTIGFLTLPWAMLGEVYPLKIRGLASGMTTCFANLLSFIAIKLYPGMISSFGVFNVFLFFTVMIMIGTIYVTIFLPETQGKSLIEIEEYFNAKPKSDS